MFLYGLSQFFLLVCFSRCRCTLETLFSGSNNYVLTHLKMFECALRIYNNSNAYNGYKINRIGCYSSIQWICIRYVYIYTRNIFACTPMVFIYHSKCTLGAKNSFQIQMNTFRVQINTSVPCEYSSCVKDIFTWYSRCIYCIWNVFVLTLYSPVLKCTLSYLRNIFRFSDFQRGSSKE